MNKAERKIIVIKPDKYAVVANNIVEAFDEAMKPFCIPTKWRNAVQRELLIETIAELLHRDFPGAML